jgi:hypothetical protein
MRQLTGTIWLVSGAGQASAAVEAEVRPYYWHRSTVSYRVISRRALRGEPDFYYTQQLSSTPWSLVNLHLEHSTAADPQAEDLRNQFILRLLNGEISEERFLVHLSVLQSVSLSFPNPEPREERARRVEEPPSRPLRALDSPRNR